MAVQMSAWWQTTVRIQVSKLIVRVLYKLFLCFVHTKSLWGLTFCLLFLLLFVVPFFCSLIQSLSIYLIVCVVICSKMTKNDFLFPFCLSLSIPFFAPLWSLTFQQINNERVSTEFERSGRFEGSRWGVSDCGNPYFLSWLIIFVCCGRIFSVSHCRRDQSVC